MRWTILSTICWLGLLGGCVSQNKYEELQTKYANAQAKIGKHEKKIGTLKEELAAEQEKARELQAKIEQAEREKAALAKEAADKDAAIARLEGEGKRLNDEMAGLLKDRSQLKDSTARLQQALLELNRRKAEADRRVAEFKGLLSKFKSLIDAGKLKVKMVDGRMVLALPTDILFDSGSAKLSKPGKEAIQQVAAVLKDMKDRRFQVEGHTDNVPIHTAQYPSNWELSSARALVVIKAMTEAGMTGEALSAAGYGEHHPASGNDTDTGRADNRRIEIVVVPDLSMLPGFEELKRVVEQQ